MALKSAMAKQWGFKKETTPGTAVVVDKFTPVIDLTPVKDVERIESEAVIAGRRVLTSGMWAPGKIMATLGVQTDLYNDDLATLLDLILGDSSSPYTPGDKSGTAATVQVGIPDTSGTVQPLTFVGCKVTNANIAAEVGNTPVRLGIDFDAMNAWDYRVVTDGVLNETTTVTSATAAFAVDDVGKPISGTGIPAAAYIVSVTSATAVVISAAATATASSVSVTIGVALASASYTSGLVPCTFRHGSVTIGGSAVKAKAIDLTIAPVLDIDRYALGQASHDEALETGLIDVTGSVDLEFVDMTQLRRYWNASEHAMVLTFAVGSTFSLAITMNVRFDGVTPPPTGRGIVRQVVPFKAVASGADSTAISVALTEPA